MIDSPAMTGTRTLGTLSLLVLALLAACDLLEATPTSTPTAPPGAGSISASATQIFDEARLAMAGRSFHVEGDFQVASQVAGLTLRAPLTTSIDVAVDGEFAGTVSVTIPVVGTIATEFVYADGKMNAVNPLTGGWAVIATAPVPLDPIGLLPVEILNLTYIGEETLEGVQVYHLRGTVPPGTLLGEGSGELSADFWIGVGDHLVRKIAGAGGVSVEVSPTVSVAGQADFILAVSAFDEPVTIAEPTSGSMPSPTATPALTPEATPTLTPTPTSQPSATPTPSPTPTMTPTPFPTATPTPTPTPEPTPTPHGYTRTRNSGSRGMPSEKRIPVRPRHSKPSHDSNWIRYDCRVSGSDRHASGGLDGSSYGGGMLDRRSSSGDTYTLAISPPDASQGWFPVKF